MTATTVNIVFVIDFDNAKTTTEGISGNTHWIAKGKTVRITETPILIGDKVIGHVHEEEYDSGLVEFEAHAVNALGSLGSVDGLLDGAMEVYRKYTAIEAEDADWVERCRAYEEWSRQSREAYMQKNKL